MKAKHASSLEAAMVGHLRFVNAGMAVWERGYHGVVEADGGGSGGSSVEDAPVLRAMRFGHAVVALPQRVDAAASSPAVASIAAGDVHEARLAVIGGLQAQPHEESLVVVGRGGSNARAQIPPEVQGTRRGGSGSTRSSRTLRRRKMGHQRKISTDLFSSQRAVDPRKIMKTSSSDHNNGTHHHQSGSAKRKDKEQRKRGSTLSRAGGSVIRARKSDVVHKDGDSPSQSSIGKRNTRQTLLELFQAEYNNEESRKSPRGVSVLPSSLSLVPQQPSASPASSSPSSSSSGKNVTMKEKDTRRKQRKPSARLSGVTRTAFIDRTMSARHLKPKKRAGAVDRRIDEDTPPSPTKDPSTGGGGGGGKRKVRGRGSSRGKLKVSDTGGMSAKEIEEFKERARTKYQMEERESLEKLPDVVASSNPGGGTTNDDDASSVNEVESSSEHSLADVHRHPRDAPSTCLALCTLRGVVRAVHLPLEPGGCPSLREFSRSVSQAFGQSHLDLFYRAPMCPTAPMVRLVDDQDWSCAIQQWRESATHANGGVSQYASITCRATLASARSSPLCTMWAEIRMENHPFPCAHHLQFASYGSFLEAVRDATEQRDVPKSLMIEDSRGDPVIVESQEEVGGGGVVMRRLWVYPASIV